VHVYTCAPLPDAVLCELQLGRPLLSCMYFDMHWRPRACAQGPRGAAPRTGLLVAVGRGEAGVVHRVHERPGPQARDGGVDGVAVRHDQHAALRLVRDVLAQRQAAMTA
jgi:hypothetical protein